VLDPSRFKEHPPPTRLTDGGLQEAVTAWEAVTAPEPCALLAFLTDRQTVLPFLQRALSSLLHHYPDLSTGLNAWEYQLLQYVRDEGPKGQPVRSANRRSPPPTRQATRAHTRGSRRAHRSHRSNRALRSAAIGTNTHHFLFQSCSALWLAFLS
jgi:hypothetical protein